MKVLYNERNCISATWDDFLNLPKIAGYVNNVKRVPNSFSNAKDKKDDPHTTMDDCLKVPKVEEHNPTYIYRCMTRQIIPIHCTQIQTNSSW